MSEPIYTVIYQQDDKDQPTVAEIKTLLESPKDEVKIATMKKMLLLMLNGDSLPALLMHVIRFIMPCKNKTLKKLVLIYWEICPKHNADGKLKQEMILMCNALRNDLQHPNEYIRGMTLRFVCKLKEPELLEPTIPTVKACLEHRHPFVRKNAILAISSVYKSFEYLIPDAPELINNFLIKETDPGAKRNAFLMLMNTSQQMAVNYLTSVWPQITTSFDELLQLASIELIRKDCKSPGSDKAKYIQCIFSLLNSTSHSVKYEAANTLVALSPHSTAVKAAASCYIELILKESDNNVKLIVLKRLDQLRSQHSRIIDDLVMDILRVLSSPDIEVRRVCLSIAMEMVSSRNVDEVVAFLKKELVKTHDGSEYEKTAEYRQLLIHAIHTCAIKFSEVAASVVHVLMEFVGESGSNSAVDVIAFVREVMEKFPQLRAGIIDRLLENFAEMKTGRVFRGALWIIGEYASDGPAIIEAMGQIRGALGDVPILASEQRMLEPADENSPVAAELSPTAKQPVKQRVLADGSYASESAFNTLHRESTTVKAVKPPLRALLLNGDFYLGSVLSTSLTKLVSRFERLGSDVSRSNELKAEAMLIMTSIIRIGRSDFPTSKIDEDSHDRILTCLRVLSSRDPQDIMKDVFLVDCREAYRQLVEVEQAKKDEAAKRDAEVVNVHADDVIAFRHLKSKRALAGTDEYDLDLTRATGTSDKTDKMVNKLSRVIQLTGFSDSVYAEAYINVHQYDIMLDVLIVNQTNETMQNLTLEFSTLGDLKLVERPTPHTLAPRGFHSIKANIKVSSTETGVIFGNIVYDGPSALDMNCIILADIHIDIMDYINPAICSEIQFRSMWLEFEWENKVNVNTNISDLREYLSHILASTNMACLTPSHALEGECGILAGNLYAKSIFGEDALANICLELEGGVICGHIRIRSKTQGIALSLGDKITVSQKAARTMGLLGR